MRHLSRAPVSYHVSFPNINCCRSRNHRCPCCRRHRRDELVRKTHGEDTARVTAMAGGRRTDGVPFPRDGSTATVVLLVGNKLFAANCGDSTGELSGSQSWPCLPPRVAYVYTLWKVSRHSLAPRGVSAANPEEKRIESYGYLGSRTPKMVVFISLEALAQGNAKGV